MRIGLRAGLARLAEVQELGFGYLEASVTEIGNMPEEQFREALAVRERLDFPVPRCNCLFPGSIKLLERTLDGAAHWLQHAFPRLRQLGVERVVFGSGGSRRRPEKMPYAVALRRLTAAARLVGDAAAHWGLEITLEPLRAEETNLLNTVAETAAFAAGVAHPAVSVLADYYHIAASGEPVDDLLRLGGVRHVHVATAQGRRWPTVPEEGLTRFLQALAASGYDGLVSVEGSSDDWHRDAAPAIALLRDALG